MSKLNALFEREKRLAAQQREIKALESEVLKLRQQNERMREGMRRCVTCEYRIEVVARREAEGDPKTRA
jgi:uncharacterized protein with PIN domain